MSEKFVDEPLGVKPKNTPVEDTALGVIKDVTPELLPETLDFAAFVAGARPTRRAVTLYARGDLKATLDRLGEEIDLVEKAGDRKRAAELRKDAAAVVEEMTAPGAVLDVVVEGRSDDWVNRLNDALDKDKVKDETERVLRRVAAQVVQPEGVTYELLEQFRQISEPQVKKLVVAAQMANSQPVNVDAHFLQRASGSTGMRGSASR